MPIVTYTYDPCGRLTCAEWDNGSVLVYTYDSCGNRLMTYSIEGGGCKLEVVTQTDDFTADQASTYYIIDGAEEITVTMPASLDLGYGSLMKFKVVSGSAVFTFDGTETFGHAVGTRDQSLILLPESGVLECVSVEQGYDET